MDANLRGGNMTSLPESLSKNLLILGLLSAGLWACNPSSTSESPGQGGSPGTGGSASGGSGSGGTTSAGGSGTGGTTSSGGSVGSGGQGSGGVKETGGTTQGSGGSATGGTTERTGGSATGGRTTGGATGTGGATSSGGAGGRTGGATGLGGRDGGMGGRTGPDAGSGGTGTGGSTGTGSGGSTGTDTCVKGQTQGKNVAVCGESFIAIAHGLTKELEALATAAGSLKSGEHYDDESISGTWMSQGADSIPNQYKRAQDKNDIKYVVMDGGGNDCMNGGNGDNIITAATALFKQMATDGVLKAVYFWMPDPVGSQYSNLKSCLDTTRPKIKSLCEGLTSPKCYYVDLRESWNGHPEYTSDGIHPTSAGDKASAKQIWDVMVKNCVAQ